MSEFKAYRVEDSKSDECCSTIVFAKSASEAKTIALATDTCSEAQYIDIRVKRLPGADHLYKGQREVGWYDSETRLTLVRDFSWSCYETSFECDSCPAKPYCRCFEDEEVTEDG